MTVITWTKTYARGGRTLYFKLARAAQLLTILTLLISVMKGTWRRVYQDQSYKILTRSPSICTLISKKIPCKLQVVWVQSESTKSPSKKKNSRCSRWTATLKLELGSPHLTSPTTRKSAIKPRQSLNLLKTKAYIAEMTQAQRRLPTSSKKAHQ